MGLPADPWRKNPLMPLFTARSREEVLSVDEGNASSESPNRLNPCLPFALEMSSVNVLCDAASIRNPASWLLVFYG